jgi:hypothetical protein
VLGEGGAHVAMRTPFTQAPAPPGAGRPGANLFEGKSGPKHTNHPRHAQSARLYSGRIGPKRAKEASMGDTGAGNESPPEEIKPPTGGPAEQPDVVVVGADRDVAVVGDVVQVVRRTSRFSREVVATMIALTSAAFGVVAALAWNTAITGAFDRYLSKGAKLSAQFIYAGVVTLIGVLVIVLLGRLAARLNAEPVEFKYPAVPKT